MAEMQDLGDRIEPLARRLAPARPNDGPRLVVEKKFDSGYVAARAALAAFGHGLGRWFGLDLPLAPTARSLADQEAEAHAFYHRYARGEDPAPAKKAS